MAKTRKHKKNTRTATPSVEQVAEENSIISPWVDFLCVGGISIIVMVGFLAFLIPNHTTGGGRVNFGDALILQALLNWPHFMASYRLLYLPVENIKKYKSSSIFVPAALIAIIIIAIISGDGTQGGVLHVDQQISYLVWLGAAFYLAWHYTGQAWGMISSFSHLAGIKMDNLERKTIRTGLRILLAWHVVWGAQDLPEAWLGGAHQYVDDLLQLMSIAAVLALIAGSAAFLRIKKRTGKSPTIQMLAPWLAIYLWYLVLYFEPSAYIYVQLSHSLQYLIFPLRVELNRRGYYKLDTNAAKQLLWSTRYYVVLIASGLMFFYLPGKLFESGSQTYSIAFLIASAISIHHYFVDSCIWKISNPDVRQSLFCHINRKSNR